MIRLYDHYQKICICFCFQAETEEHSKIKDRECILQRYDGPGPHESNNWPLRCALHHYTNLSLIKTPKIKHKEIMAVTPGWWGEV